MVAILAAGLIASGCGGGTDTDETAADGLAGIQEAVDNGTDCGGLFDLMNAADPDAPWRDDANELLRGIGCFSSSSTRTD